MVKRKKKELTHNKKKNLFFFVTCLKFSQKAAVSRLYELIKLKIMVNLVYTYESE